jgi:hypothetical protein
LTRVLDGLKPGEKRGITRGSLFIDRVASGG